MEARNDDVRVSPGKEDEFRYFQRQYAASAAVDRLIEATEPANREANDLEFDQFQDRAGVTDRPLSEAFDSVVNEEVLEAMWTHEYVAQKISELNSEELDRALRNNHYARSETGPGAFARLVAATGRSLRRVGQRLESWGTIEDDDQRIRC